MGTEGGFPASAFVDVDGAVHRARDPAGSEGPALLVRYRPLVDYAVALLRSGAGTARFFWRTPDRQWMHVLIQEAEGRTGATVTLQRQPLPAGLTSRELDVLTLIAGGLTNRQIAARLVASVRTVSTHVEHILAKLGQSSRTGAAAVAVDRGWIRLPLPGGGALDDLAVGAVAGGAHRREQPAPLRAVRNGARHEARHEARDEAWHEARQTARRSRLRPLVIGSALPLSGPVAGDGQEMVNGATLAVAEINARGGVGGRSVRHLVVDVDVFSADDVRRAFAALLDAGVDALISGYYFAEDAARDAAAASGVPYLHCMTSELQALAVTENHRAYRNVFQVCATERHYGPAFIRTLRELEASGHWRPGSRRLAFLETTLPSGQMVNRQTVDAAEAAGWSIDLVETAPALGADWPPTIDRVVRHDPAAVMVTQFLAGELASFQREMARQAPETLVYAVYTPSVPEFVELAGDAAEGLLWATVTGTYSDAIGRQFRQAYERTFGRPSGLSNAGIAYDQVHLMAAAWSSASDPLDHRAVCDRLRQIRYRGVNGSYYLNNPAQSGLCFPDSSPDPSLAQAHLVFQVQDGAHRIIAPAPYAEAGFRPPIRQGRAVVGGGGR